MTNDSSTGGPIAPYGAGPLEGQELNRFIQQWVVGITGLDGTLVRPRWQEEPANIPNAGTAWVAIGITSRVSDNFPYVAHNGAGSGSDTLQRHEILKVLSSFYDLGTNGLADLYASLLRDGASIAQNREYLAAQAFALINTEDLVSVPVLIKSRWMYRVDLAVNLRRLITRTYPVRNLLSADIEIVNDAGFSETVNTTPIVES